MKEMRDETKDGGDQVKVTTKATNYATHIRGQLLN